MEENPRKPMIGQVFVLNEADFIQLGKVRAITGIFAAKSAEKIWLKGIPMPQFCPKSITQLPAIERFFLDEEERLFQEDSRIPNQFLPKLEWLEISTFVSIDLPISAFAGQTRSTAELEFVPSNTVHASDLLLCRLSELKVWTENAPQIRIDQLRYAVSEGAEQQAFVHGSPLPNIPGKSFWACGKIYLPSGFTLKQGFLHDFLKAQCDPQGKGMVILRSQSNFELILDEDFVQLSRSGIRKMKHING
jgi:hypothetical protein